LSIEGFVDFCDYFGRFSILFAGVVYGNRYKPRKKKSKIGSKEHKNRQKLKSTTVSKRSSPIRRLEAAIQFLVLFFFF